MFCPKCATPNLEGASFCRSCGANISLVPQALAGQVSKQVDDDDGIVIGRRGRKRRRELSLDHAFKNIFMGIAFLLVAFALANSIGRGWWFWMLLPAFSMMGTGIAQFIRLKEKEKQNLFVRDASPRAFADRPPLGPQPELQAPRTGELMAPVPSVTEGTTRHLGAEVATRRLESDKKE